MSKSFSTRSEYEFVAVCFRSIYSFFHTKILRIIGVAISLIKVLKKNVSSHLSQFTSFCLSKMEKLISTLFGMNVITVETEIFQKYWKFSKVNLKSQLIDFFRI